jgi:hypothetical protein
MSVILTCIIDTSIIFINILLLAVDFLLHIFLKLVPDHGFLQAEIRSSPQKNIVKTVVVIDGLFVYLFTFGVAQSAQ